MTVFSDGKTVADHPRAWAWHQTLTDPEHLEAAKTMRTRIGAQMRALRPVRQGTDELAVEQRPLTDYDTALGIELDGGFAS